MIKSYCIGSLNDLDVLPALDRAQFTLNGRMSPSKRNAGKHLSDLSILGTDIFVHYDFLRTIPRYPLMTAEQKAMMIQEFVDILDVSAEKVNIRGIVIHMDTAFRQEFIKELFKGSVTLSKITKLATKWIISPMYVTAEEAIPMIVSVLGEGYETQDPKDLQRQFLLSWNAIALTTFNTDLLMCIGERVIETECKIYIENSAHLTSAGGASKESPFVAAGLLHNALITAGLGPLYGVCWDTEHAYAADDLDISDQETFVNMIQMNPRVLVHLNTVEKGVTRGSGKDRHSVTSVYDCSVYPSEYYFGLAALLEKLNIPYIREVKTETMMAELEVQAKQANG